MFAAGGGLQFELCVVDEVAAANVDADISILDESPFVNQPEPVYFTQVRLALIGIFSAQVLLLVLRS